MACTSTVVDFNRDFSERQRSRLEQQWQLKGLVNLPLLEHQRDPLGSAETHFRPVTSNKHSVAKIAKKLGCSGDRTNKLGMKKKTMQSGPTNLQGGLIHQRTPGICSTGFQLCGFLVVSLETCWLFWLLSSFWVDEITRLIP